MKKLLTLFLAAISLNAAANEIAAQEYAQLFKKYNACFILYNVNEHKIVSEYKYSVLWVSQQITPQLGYARIKHYLAGFDYGNQDFRGDPGKNNGLTHAWLASSLKISAVEQLNFLNSMLSNELPVANEAVASTKKNLYLGKLDNGANYYGKSGSGRHGRNERETNPSKLRDGWFVGFVESGKQQYIFVSNLTDKVIQASIDKSDGSLKPYGSQILKPITMQLLNAYFVK